MGLHTALARHRFGRRPAVLGTTAFALFATVVVAGALAAGRAVHAAEAARTGSVTICMATRDRTRPYAKVSADANLIAWRGRGQTGPVYSPGLPPYQSWGDIIPPFTSTSGVPFPGQNWSSAGRPVYNAGCTVAATGSPSTGARPAPAPLPSTTRAARRTTTSTVVAPVAAPPTTPAPSMAPPTTMSSGPPPTTAATADLAAAPEDPGSIDGDPAGYPVPGFPAIIGVLLMVAGAGLLLLYQRSLH